MIRNGNIFYNLALSMLQNNVRLDLFVAELIEADHYLQEHKKSLLKDQLLKYSKNNSLLEIFYFLDNIKSNSHHISIHSLTSNEIGNELNILTDELSKFQDYAGLNRQSKYILDNGKISVSLPSHYKFDRAIANRLNLCADLINKDNLIVPIYSNTIRIYLDFAVLIYKPTNNQIKSLNTLGIKKYFIFDQYVDSLFDPLIDKLPNFVSVQ